MPARTYDQYCAVARALDVLGDRWTLLVVRELLDGPKRYADLLAGLRTISTDILARRLRDLEDAGLIERHVLPPPAASRVYRLTEQGAQVEPVIESFARFGFGLLGERRAGESVDLRWLSLAIRALLEGRRPATDLTVRFDTPDGDATIRITPDGVCADDTAEADVVLTGPVEVLVEALDGDRARALVAAGALGVAGRAADVRAFTELLGTRSPR